MIDIPLPIQKTFSITKQTILKKKGKYQHQTFTMSPLSAVNALNSFPQARRFVIGDPQLRIKKSDFSSSELIRVFGPNEFITVQKLLTNIDSKGNPNVYYALVINPESDSPQLSINYLVLATPMYADWNDKIHPSKRKAISHFFTLLNNTPEGSGHAYLEHWTGKGVERRRRRMDYDDDDDYNAPAFMDVPVTVMSTPTIRMVCGSYEDIHKAFFWDEDTYTYIESKTYMFHPHLESTLAPMELVQMDLYEAEQTELY